MMDFSKILSASKSILQVNSEMLNAVAFGPDAHDRASGALDSLALTHLKAITRLSNPEENNWLSAFALSRIAAEAALRSVYLGFGDSAPNFTQRYKAFMEDKPNPFGSLKNLLSEIRVAFKSYPLFVAWSDSEPRDTSDMILQHLEADWSSLNNFTHSGEMQARLVLHQIRTDDPPHDNIRCAVLFVTTRVVTECIGIVLAQRGEPQRGGFLAQEFVKVFPPNELTFDE